MKRSVDYFLFFVLLFTGLSVNAQERINGVVRLDGEDIPAIGATVRVEGTDRGTVTDLDGQFSIEATEGETIIASYVGYEAVSKVATSDNMVFILNASTAIDKVVVTALGVEKNEREIGYSIQSVDVEDINKSGQVNALESLQGRVSGVQINKTSGGAGSGFDITIRGLSSINPGRSNQPLFIVDGVAIDNSTSTGNVLPSAGSNAQSSSEQFGFTNRAADINPEDIKDINILKGAAATALYGIRASNGAVIITTKSGSRGKPKINLSTSTSFNHIQKLPSLQKTWREGHRTSMNPTIEDDSEDGFFRPSGFTFYTWGPKYTEDFFPLNDGTLLDLSNDRFHNPYKDLFETGQNYQGNFSISGADEKLSYYLSAGLSDDQGIIPNTNYEKKSFRFKTDYQVNENFKVNSTVAYTKSGGARGTGGDKSIMSTLSYWATSFDVNDYLQPDGTQKNASSFSDNPRYFAETSVLEDDVNRWIGSIGFNWQAFPFMSVKYTAQMDNYSDQRNRFVPPVLDVGTQVNGFVVDENTVYNGLESNLLVTFNHEFTDKFRSELLIGNQINTSKEDYEYQRGEGLNIPTINALTNTTTLFGDKSIREEKVVGAFGNLSMTYNNNLTLSLTGRNDWLSTMPEDNRSFFYPSASLSYAVGDIIDPEGDLVSFGKLRTSFARVGKGPGIGQIGAFLIRDPAFPFNSTGGYRADVTIGDPNIVPEFTNSFEIGSDFRFLDNRLRFDYAYYTNKISDQIIPVRTALTSGISRYVRNAGSYKTWGHEAIVSADFLSDNKFSFTSTLNFSTNKGEITELPDDLEEIVYYDNAYVSSKAVEGGALGDLYGWVYQTAPNGERLVGDDGYWTVTGSENEGLWFDGLNEQVKVGNALPDFIFSLGNDLNYENFSLGFLLEWKNGGQLHDTGMRNAIRNGNLLLTEFRNEEVILDGVQLQDNGSFVENTTPALISANEYYRSSTRFNAASEVIVQDADWLKLRQVSLGYQLPSTFANRIGMQSATVSASANNIILWTPWDGFDPEGSLFSAGSNIYGFTGLNIPLGQRYSFGFNFQF